MRELPFQKSKTSFASTYFTLGKKTSLFAISKLFKIILAGWFKGKF